MKVDAIIANGTAVLAFAASSLIWTVESNALIVQTGAKKLNTNANPFGQPSTEKELSKHQEIYQYLVNLQFANPPSA